MTPDAREAIERLTLLAAACDVTGVNVMNLPVVSRENAPRFGADLRLLLATLPAPSDATVESAEALARRFHEAYERLAPLHGYETREDTRDFDPTSPNGRLMIAVCQALQAVGGGEGGGWVRVPREPTQRMRSAAVNAMLSAEDSGGECCSVCDYIDLPDVWAALGAYARNNTPGAINFRGALLATAYRAMIAAAPVSDGSSQEGGVDDG